MLDFINANLVNFSSSYEIYYSAIIAYITYAIMYFLNIWDDDDTIVACFICLTIHLTSHIWFLTVVTSEHGYFILTPIIYAILFYGVTIAIRPYVISFINLFNKRYRSN